MTRSVAETTHLFTDQTQQAGIHFKHTNGASEEKYLPETMGAGGLFFDYNNDGHLDIYLVNSGTLGPDSQRHRHPDYMNVLYRNKGDGTFVDATAEAGLHQNYGYGMGGLAADYDNDGMPTFTSPTSVETNSIGTMETAPSQTLRHMPGLGTVNGV